MICFCLVIWCFWLCLRFDCVFGFGLSRYFVVLVVCCMVCWELSGLVYLLLGFVVFAVALVFGLVY